MPADERFPNQRVAPTFGFRRAEDLRSDDLTTMWEDQFFSYPDTWTKNPDLPVAPTQVGPTYNDFNFPNMMYDRTEGFRRVRWGTDSDALEEIITMDFFGAGGGGGRGRLRRQQTIHWRRRWR